MKHRVSLRECVFVCTRVGWGRCWEVGGWCKWRQRKGTSLVMQAPPNILLYLLIRYSRMRISAYQAAGLHSRMTWGQTQHHFDNEKRMMQYARPFITAKMKEIVTPSIRSCKLQPKCRTGAAGMKQTTILKLAEALNRRTLQATADHNRVVHMVGLHAGKVVLPELAQRTAPKKKKLNREREMHSKDIT